MENNMKNIEAMDPKALAEQLQKEGKAVLSLIIKQQYFNEILSGEKKQEFREIKPSTEKKYIIFEEDGYPREDEDGNCVPIHYDYLLLYVGYNADRDSMLIECTGAHCECILDEEGEPLFYFINDKTKKEAFPTTYDPETGEGYDENDQKMEDVVQYFVEQITYDLGKIVAKKVK